MIRDAELIAYRNERREAFAAKCMKIALLVMAVVFGLMMYGVASAQGVANVGAPVPAPAPSVWLQLLTAVLPFIIAGLVALHPLLKLSSFLHAKTLDANASTALKAGASLGEHLATSLDKYLEESESDLATIAGDPAKRATALKALEDRAKAEVPATLASAVGALGTTALTGKAVQVLDAAVAKAANPPTPAS